MPRRSLDAVILIILVALPSIAFATSNYTVQDLGRGYAVSINDSGRVVGSLNTSPGNSPLPFVYSGGVYSIISVGAGDYYGQATSINNSGIVSGNYGVIENNSVSGYGNFLYNSATGILTNINLNGVNTYSDSRINSVNDSGHYTGAMHFENNPVYQMPFVSDGSSFKMLSTLSGFGGEAFSINNNDVAVGMIATEEIVDGWQRTRAFVYDGTTSEYLALPGHSRALGVNDANVIVGRFGEKFDDRLQHGFIYGNGSYTDLGLGVALGVNNKNSVVGTSFIPGDSSAYLYEDNTMYSLISLVTGKSEFMSLNWAFDINERGQIVGQGRTMNGEWHAFLATPVEDPNPTATPEPSTMLLMGIGAAGAAFMRRRKMKQAN